VKTHRQIRLANFSRALLATTFACLGFAVSPAGAQQTSELSFKRLGAVDGVKPGVLGNSALDIDGKDDKRVDASIAVIDSGFTVNYPDLNLVKVIDCIGVTEGTKSVCDDSPKAALGEVQHGTGFSLLAAGIDNGFGKVGVAPGARIYGINIIDKKNVFKPKLEGTEPFFFSLEGAIAGLRWVQEHNDESTDTIEVVVSTVVCSWEVLPFAFPWCSGEEALEYEEVEKELVDEGVVVVNPAGVMPVDVSTFVGAASTDPIVVSAVQDLDGAPGGTLTTEFCRYPYESWPDPLPIDTPDKDDSLTAVSGRGTGIDIAAPTACAVSGALPLPAGAAAVLASADNASNYAKAREFVETIRHTLAGDSDCAVNSPDKDPNVGAGRCDWTDESGDPAKEPLLDVSTKRDASGRYVHSEEAGYEGAYVFDPETAIGSEPAAADSDVNGDGRADLVSLRANGVVYVHLGGTDVKFGSGVSSFSDGKGGGTLDPAQYDGKGNYVVDVADVTGDKRADLVTLTDDGKLHVFAANSNGTFQTNGVTSNLGLSPGLLTPGGHEPLAVADINGDGYADLIAFGAQASAVIVYPGGPTGGFAGAVQTPVEATGSLASARHTGVGHFFLDAADVDGDGRADLVSLNSSGDLSTFLGRSNWTVSKGVVSQAGQLNVAMDDGVGYEPVGLADVTGDRKADAVLVKAGVIYVYPASQTGSYPELEPGTFPELGSGAFNSPVTSFAGTLTSTTFGPGAYELLGVLDVNGDGRADLTGAASSDHKVRVVQGQSSGAFSNIVVSEGTFPSTQHHENQNSTGNEFVIEKPSWRRLGCREQGCGWTIDSTPNDSGTTNNSMTGISCTSATFCMATANSINGSGKSFAYSARWNGSSWTFQEVPSNTGVKLNGVSCLSTTNCIAVGTVTEGTEVKNIAEHWNGTTWSAKYPKNASGGIVNQLTSIHCASATFCVAPGYLTNAGGFWGYVRVWDGTAWQTGASILPSNTGIRLNGVSCVSTTNCIAVGTKTEGTKILNVAEHWNGSAWNTQLPKNAPGADDNRLTSIACLSATFCVAPGYLTNAGGFWGYVRVWDGTAWQTGASMLPSNTGIRLNGVSCVSTTNCIAVGTQTEGSNVIAAGMLFDGSRWTKVYIPSQSGSTQSQLASVSCNLTCTAVGSYTTATETRTLAMRGR
jgi:FG-GAP-like repeat